MFGQQRLTPRTGVVRGVASKGRLVGLAASLVLTLGAVAAAGGGWFDGH